MPISQDAGLAVLTGQVTIGFRERLLLWIARGLRWLAGKKER